jgi:hypothetical protein
MSPRGPDGVEFVDVIIPPGVDGLVQVPAEGSVRYLAPELSLIEVFKGEMQHVMLSLAAETVSKEQMARTALELMLGIGSVTDQVNALMRSRHYTSPPEG